MGIWLYGRDAQLSLSKYLLQVLGQSGANIPTHAKNGDIDEFGTAVGHLASAVCQITEAGAQVSLSIHWCC